MHHTPGSWHAEKQHPAVIPAHHIKDNSGMMIAYTGHTRTPGQADANAALIAAAPELLEMLDNVTAAMNTMLIHYGDRQTSADREQRSKLLGESVRLLGQHGSAVWAQGDIE